MRLFLSAFAPLLSRSGSAASPLASLLRYLHLWLLFWFLTCGLSLELPHLFLLRVWWWTDPAFMPVFFFFSSLSLSPHHPTSQPIWAAESDTRWDCRRCAFETNRTTGPKQLSWETFFPSDVTLIQNISWDWLPWESVTLALTSLDVRPIKWGLSCKVHGLTEIAWV